MNRYAAQIRDRWLTTAPTRYAALEDPETFFSEMGDLVLARVTDLSTELAGQDSEKESYLEKVGRLSSAMRQAEEIALSELDWPPIELTEDEAREEWEATRPQEQGLVEWASRQEETVSEDELQRQAAEWLLPIEFLRELTTSTNPWTYLAEHSETVTTSQQARYQRHQTA